MTEPALDVLHVDNHVLAVHKPAGLPVVPDASGDPSLLDLARDWVARTYDKRGNVFLGVVHRLDRPVSGVVVLGRTSKGAARLTRAFAERAVSKTYWGVVPRVPRPDTGRIEHHLWKDTDRNRVHVVGADRPGAKPARTTYRVLERRDGDGAALLELVPETGRAHQLRVACATLGAPLRGDLRYGDDPPLPDRSVALHACELVVPHPTRDVELVLGAPPPATAVWDFHAVARAPRGVEERPR